MIKVALSLAAVIDPLFLELCIMTGADLYYQIDTSSGLSPKAGKDIQAFQSHRATGHPAPNAVRVASR